MNHKQNQLKCLYTNANSLSNKRSELQLRIDVMKPDLIGITEVWQKEEYVVQGYHQAFRKDRKAHKVGGGVLILVKECWKVSECLEMTGPEDDEVEAVWCSIKVSKQNTLLVGVIYRTPSSSHENNVKLNYMLRKISQVGANSVLLMGDFNYGQIDWEKGIVEGAYESDQEQFLDTMNDLYLFQHVHKPTRFREGHRPAILDLVFTQLESEIDEIIIGEPLGKSDHAVLTWDLLLSCHVEKQKGSDKLNFAKADFENIRRKLNETGVFLALPMLKLCGMES